MCLQEILYQSTLTDEIVRLLDIKQNYETLIRFSNSCQIVSKLTLPLIQQSYKSELIRPPTISSIFRMNRPWDLPSNIDGYGTKNWYSVSVGSHRNRDLPAVVYLSGKKIWCQNDQIHRDNDRPAVIDRDGSKHWYNRGNLHRNDLPAIINDLGMEWYQNGELYRNNDLPTMVGTNGVKMWAKNQHTLHRDNDKPAIVRPDGTMEWYHNGVQYSPSWKISLFYWLYYKIF